MAAVIGTTYKITGGLYRGYEGVYLGTCRRGTRAKVRITKCRYGPVDDSRYWTVVKQISPRFVGAPKEPKQMVDDAIQAKFKLR